MQHRTYQIWLPQSLNDLFNFFSDARNLEILTPSWLRFSILTPGEIEMKTGALIDYRLRVRGIPLRWQSEITVWQPPFCFVDEQRRGPYRVWKHEHRFSEKDGGTLVEDRVAYSVWGEWLFDPLFVRRDVERIFRFRGEKLQELFAPTHARPAAS